MKRRVIGQSGIEASAVAFGAWAIGGGPWWGETDDDLSIRAIQTALDEGIDFIDTAPVYGFGRSEEIVGRALKGRRDKAIVATKCGLWWADQRGSEHFSLDGKTVNRCLKPETIRIELESSLRRLDTDYIDLYQTHWQSVEPDFTPIAETMACLLDLKREGKIRAIGVSNVDPKQIEAYCAVGPVDSVQPRYSMLDRHIEKDLLPSCAKHNLATLAYSPLEQGLLTGKIGMDQVFDEGAFRNMLPWYKPANRKRVLELLAGWSDLTADHSCTLAQLVIAWTIAQPGITFALCGARKPANVVDNAGAGSLELAVADIERIRRDVEALGDPE
ncbi:MAG: aldo/keto reductase [Verrucomicrobia bacterium]|mgnify:CR=1 FL=1|jgi:methylglyoxal reductase|nr:aldo/keto reductase [Verrucomicrobiota bacterium]MBT7699229.1 aldo/keto reductase [Verrucomicrobiota bacterium]